MTHQNFLGLLLLRLLLPSFLICILLFALDVCSSSSEVDSTVVISTKMGLLRGNVVRAMASGMDDVVTTQFLGIPYAQPPVGELRFRQPQKNHGWMLVGIFNTTMARPRCQTDGLAHDELQKEEEEEKEEAEDCLYINIYVPGNLSYRLSLIDTMELPVLVVLSEEDGLSPDALGDMFSHLAFFNNIVVVDLSYRSGVLSYLTISGERIMLGDVSLQDQRLALLWIWDNIREFGGNAEEITVFAEYEASISLGYHILLPESRRLFARAVMHGGTVLSPGRFQNDQSGIIKLLADAMGCSNSTSITISCLQSAALSKVKKAAAVVRTAYGFQRKVLPGQDFVSQQPLKLLQDGQFNQIDVLIGFSEQDGLCLLEKFMPDDIREEMPHSFMERLIKYTIKNLYENASSSEKVFTTVLSAVLLEYFSCGDIRNGTKAVAELLTDMVYRAPAELTVRLASRRHNNVYLYSFSNGNYICRSLIKSFTQLNKCELNQNCGHRMTKNFFDLLVNFVQNGNPNVVGGTNDWKSFSEEGRHYLMISDEGTQLKQSVGQRRMAFWNDYFPYLLISDSDSCQSDPGVLNSSVVHADQEKNLPWVLAFLGAVGAGLLLLVVCLTVRSLSQHLRKAGGGGSCSGWFGLCCQREMTRPTNVWMINKSPEEEHKFHPLPYSDE